MSLPNPHPSYDKSNVKVEEVAIDGGAKRLLNAANETTDDEMTTANNPLSAQRAPLGVRIVKGRSLVTLSNILTRDEIDYLVQSSMEAASTQTIRSSTNTDASGDHDSYDGPGRVCVRMPTRAAADRNEIPDSDNLHDPLPKAVSEFIEERILERAFDYIDHELCQSVKETLFGNDDISLLELFQNKALIWSNREPAVNVYEAGGHFGMHKDNQALTILLPLSSRGDDADFTGGGTAFYSQTHPRESMHAPSLVLAPQAGTALLFGGQVYHKGLTIHTGHRVVFVASFSRPRKSKTWRVSAR